ncbi:MAG: aminotransferase class IV [Chitinophagaceae bacterium]|nr:aminotransferase class IV [Chitinophagaceae bacterium]
MFPLFETIRSGPDGLFHLDSHLNRMKESYCQIFHGEIPYLNELEKELKTIRSPQREKCRLFYGENSFKTERLPYHPLPVRKIIFIEDNTIDYPLKFTDRTCLEKYKQQLPESAEPVFVKNGYLTDASFANLALWNGSEWITPDTPLFYGIHRSVLIQKGKIIPKPVSLNDIKMYSAIMLINAMLDWEETIVYDF